MDDERDNTMSNFDHSIPNGMEDRLRKHAGERIGEHAGYNFHGVVWYDDGMFHEMVFQYHNPMEVFSAHTLRELMSLVNDSYGSE